MKKILLVLFSVILISGITVNSYSQTGYNPVIEYCTGTWCQYCPCGEVIIDGILQNFPNAMVIGYHGYANNDPWTSFSSGMISNFGFNAYPTGIVGRKTGIIDRSAWNNRVVIQANTVQPGCTIAVNNKSYNAGTRMLTANIVLTASQNLSGNFYVNFILTEDNLIYFQQGNGGCPGSNTWVHKWVNKGMLNGDLGQVVNTGGTWNQGQQFTFPISYMIPGSVVETNSKLNILVYMQGGSLSSSSDIQQSRFESVTAPTGIINQNQAPVSYSLLQNYPNPFNPTTNIHFSVPKDGNVSLKFYDMLGNEVATYVNGFLKAGVYNTEFDGSNLASGIYFYTLKAGNFIETKKMSLIK